MKDEIQKITVTINEVEYEAVLGDNLICENCCSMCELNNICEPDSQIACLCKTIEDMFPKCGSYFIRI